MRLFPEKFHWKEKTYSEGKQHYPTGQPHSVGLGPILNKKEGKKRRMYEHMNTNIHLSLPYKQPDHIPAGMSSLLWQALSPKTVNQNEPSSSCFCLVFVIAIIKVTNPDGSVNGYKHVSLNC